MLSKNDLVSNFSDVTDIGNNIIKCLDELPKSVTYYYVKMGKDSGGKNDFLVASDNLEDDEFASSILSSLPAVDLDKKLSLLPLPNNTYGFSSLLLAPKDFHSYFKGRLDAKRDRLILCLPIHKCEFSGNETVEEFFILRRETVQTLNWRREISPKIKMRFDNPKTGGGTEDSGVFVKYESLLFEIENIDGVVDGFIEVENYLESIVEILSPAPDEYILIRNRDDATRELISKKVLLARLWSFLTD